ncbi:MAG: hypothetical protein HWE20_08615 [Gammaproteobacteria bacterium]|nr:hypothetical protein [Gammaproteobacteria bacterium]
MLMSYGYAMVRRLTCGKVDTFTSWGKADLVVDMLYEVPLTVALHFLGVGRRFPKLEAFSVAHTVNTWGRRQNSSWKWRMRWASFGNMQAKCWTKCALSPMAKAG